MGCLPVFWLHGWISRAGVFYPFLSSEGLVMSGRNLALVQERFERILWGLTLALLPLTSFRYLPFFGSSQVKPLSFLPIGLLFLSILLRCIRQKKFLFGNAALPIILVIICVFIISSSVGACLAPADLHDYTFVSRLWRAWVTLFVGLTFFFVPVVMVRCEDDLRFMMKWLFIGMIGHLVWALVQWVALHTEMDIGVLTLQNLVDLIQRSFSITGLTSTGRVSGLALEPSWLAAQIAILYLPWAFSAVLTRYSFGKYRLTPVILLGLGLVLSAMSYSRSGIIIIAVSALLTVLITGREAILSILRWFIKPFRYPKNTQSPTLHIIVRLFILSLIIVLLAGVGLFLSQNQYFAALWQVRGDDLVDYVVNIYAGPRLAYSWAGWQIFLSHPLFGVGLGASGFYFFSALPDWSHFNLSEISLILSPDYTGFPNVKNLYIRLLAEGGIVSLWVWITFYLFMFSRILLIFKSNVKYIKFVAVAGLFTFFSLLLTNFTLDSFAMPFLWLPLGVILGIYEAGEQARSS
jgi:hypothetical protein